MRHQLLARYLAAAEQYVREAEELVRRQTLLVADLDTTGVDAGFAREALALLEQSLFLATEERNRLRREMQEISARQTTE